MRPALRSVVGFGRGLDGGSVIHHIKKQGVVGFGR